MSRAAALAVWYEAHGRHDLPWRASHDRWSVLVSEVMLQQTQVSRVLAAWPSFIGCFPTPAIMATGSAGAVITKWGRLGYPRRARRLWESAGIIHEAGWPSELIQLPGVGRYTAAAICAQADDANVPAIEVNIRRVVQRASGAILTDHNAEIASVRFGSGLRGRARLLALMDLGATVCTARAPACSGCPLRRRCATRGVLEHEVRSRQRSFAGSFRQRRGVVMARLRTEETVHQADLDLEALTSLVADGLAVIRDHIASLP